MTVIYRKRRNLFEAGETEWRVEDDALVVQTADARLARYPWAELKGVRLGYAPTRFKTRRHDLVLSFTDGRTVEVDNQSFAGVADFEDRSATYVPFVRAVLAKAGTHPDLMVRVGATPMSYALNLSFVTISFAAVLAVLILLPVDLGVYLIIKIVIVATMLPALYRWIRHARPRLARPDALPDDALPQA